MATSQDPRLWKKGGKQGACQLRPDAVPAELAALRQWVAWVWDLRADREGQMKLTKVPIDPHTRKDAKTNDPDTWGSFSQSLECHVRMGHGGGVGFVFTSSDPYCGIDLDKCRDVATGSLSVRARAILARFPTYAEVSPSGTGVKLFLRGVMPQGRNRKDGIEIYDRGRFFTFTGDVVDNQPVDVAECEEELAKLHAELFPPGTVTEVQPVAPKPVAVGDEELVQKIRRSKQGEKFASLWAGDQTGYESGSEADLALVNILIGWTGGDYGRTDTLFRQSGLYRDKWERKDYRTATMDTAMSNRTWFYDPDYKANKTEGAHAAEAEATSETGPAVSPSDVATLGDLKAAGAELRFLWNGWIQHGVANILAAEGGTGKTRFIADLLRRIKGGLPWPDGMAMTAGPDFRSLWVLADNHHAEMVSIGDAFGISDMVWISAYKANPFDGTTLETLEDWKSLGAIIRAVRPHLLIVDTVGNATSKNLGRQEEAMEFYRPLQIIARKYDMPVMCLTHLAAGGNVLGRRGTEKVRVVIKMDVPDADDERRRVQVVKSNHLKPKPLGMTMMDGGAEYDHAPPLPPEGEDGEFQPHRARGRPGAKKGLCEAWLRDLLRYGAVPVGQLVKSATKGGFAKSTLYRALDEIGAKKVDRDGEEWWEWSES